MAQSITDLDTALAALQTAEDAAVTRDTAIQASLATVQAQLTALQNNPPTTPEDLTAQVAKVQALVTEAQSIGVTPAAPAAPAA